jgi:hypothetical protein
MPITVMISLGVVHLGFVANIYCLRVILVHIVNKSQVIVGEWMLWVDLSADLKMLDGHRVLLFFEVR